MNNFINHSASHAAKLAAMYSTLAELNATDLYFLLNQDIILDPMLKQHPEVLFLSFAHPAQSTFVNPANLTPPLRSYNNMYSIVPLK
jgi:hypothetical protein